jgi:hypothetical protein
MRKKTPQEKSSVNGSGTSRKTTFCTLRAKYKTRKANREKSLTKGSLQ